RDGDGRDDQRRGEEGGGVHVEGPVDRGGGGDEAAGGEADGGGPEAAYRQHRVRGGELLVGGDLGQDGGVGRVEERADGADHGHGLVEPPHAERDQERDGQHEDAAQDVADDHDALAVAPVDDDPGEEAHEERRRRGGHEHEADR